MWLTKLRSIEGSTLFAGPLISHEASRNRRSCLELFQSSPKQDRVPHRFQTRCPCLQKCLGLEKTSLLSWLLQGYRKKRACCEQFHQWRMLGIESVAGVLPHPVSGLTDALLALNLLITQTADQRSRKTVQTRLLMRFQVNVFLTIIDLEQEGDHHERGTTE